MDAFLSRCKSSDQVRLADRGACATLDKKPDCDDEEASTDLKLATLASIYDGIDQATLLDLLVTSNGSIEVVVESLGPQRGGTSSRKRLAVGSIGCQTSLSSFRTDPISPPSKRRVLTRKGQTLHLYTPEDIANNTPCSIIHNFLPPQEADNLLRELLDESPTFERQTFKLFDNVVQSPHSACFYVQNLEEQKKQKTEYLYNGGFLTVWQLSWWLREILTVSGCSPNHPEDA